MIEVGKLYVNNASIADIVKVSCIERDDGEQVVMFTRYGRDSMFSLPIMDFTTRFTILPHHGNE
mgnify:CR=1 FL=1